MTQTLIGLAIVLVIGYGIVSSVIRARYQHQLRKVAKKRGKRAIRRELYNDYSE